MTAQMDEITLQPIEHVSIGDQAYSTLRDSILRRIFQPGQQLDLDELERRLGVSRTPLNHALTRLALEGLVKIAPRRGTYVAELNADEIAERFDARCCIEVGVAERAVLNLTPERLGRIRQICERLDALVNPDGSCADYLAYIESDHELHATYIELAQNKLLSEMYESLNVHLYITRVQYTVPGKQPARANREHSEILKALEARDVPAIQRAIAKHLEASKLDTLAQMRTGKQVDFN